MSLTKSQDLSIDELVDSIFSDDNIHVPHLPRWSSYPPLETDLRNHIFNFDMLVPLRQFFEKAPTSDLLNALRAKYPTWSPAQSRNCHAFFIGHKQERLGMQGKSATTSYKFEQLVKQMPTLSPAEMPCSCHCIHPNPPASKKAKNSQGSASTTRRSALSDPKQRKKSTRRIEEDSESDSEAMEEILALAAKTKNTGSRRARNPTGTRKSKNSSKSSSSATTELPDATVSSDKDETLPCYATCPIVEGMPISQVIKSGCMCIKEHEYMFPSFVNDYEKEILVIENLITLWHTFATKMPPTPKKSHESHALQQFKQERANKPSPSQSLIVPFNRTPSNSSIGTIGSRASTMTSPVRIPEATVLFNLFYGD
jgi:hypothetical protein